MSKSVRGWVVSIWMVASGCSIHPLPEDFAGVSTYHIVRQIRCEARDAVIHSTLGWLLHDAKVSVQSRSVAQQFADGQRPIEELSPNLLQGRDKVILKLFWDTGIAYHYELEMAEENDVSTEINLLKPFTNAKGTLGLKAGAERSRQNTRTFTVTDTFNKLVTATPSSYCDNYIVEENYVYPIAGKVGVEPVIQEFVRLTLFGNLAGDSKTPKGPPTMVDALEFETKLSGSAAPKVEFSPIGKSLQVANASLTGSVSRRDLHKVTIGLAIDSRAVSQVGPIRESYLFGPLLTASGGPTEQAAAAAVNQYLTSAIFKRTIIVTQP